jgi:hypothetical protein
MALGIAILFSFGFGLTYVAVLLFDGVSGLSPSSDTLMIISMLGGIGVPAMWVLIDRVRGWWAERTRRG